MRPVGGEPAPAVRPRLPHRADHRVGHRIAELVDDAACDDAAARHRDVGLVEHLLLGQLDRTSRLERAGLPVLHVHVAGLRRVEREAAGGQLAELEATLCVGQRRLDADFRGGQPHLRAPHRGAGFGGRAPGPNPAGPGLQLLPRARSRASSSARADRFCASKTICGSALASDPPPEGDRQRDRGRCKSSARHVCTPLSPPEGPVRTPERKCCVGEFSHAARHRRGLIC